MSNPADAAFEFAANFSKVVHEYDRRLQRLADLKMRSAEQCGNCNKWMKSSQCPKEKNVNGYSRGPSMSGLACSEFDPKQGAIAAKAELISWAQEASGK